MTDQDPYYDEDVRTRRTEDADAWRSRGRRLWRWIASRPAESWLFFVGGVLVSRILF